MVGLPFRAVSVLVLVVRTLLQTNFIFHLNLWVLLYERKTKF